MSPHPFRTSHPFLLWVLLFAFSPLALAAQEGGAEGADNTPEGVVRALYDLVTFPEGTTPDWDRMRAMFLPESVVVLRTSRTANSVFTLEGFVQDWLHFIERDNVEATGFEERIVRVHSTEFGDIAHVWVLYEAQIPGRSPRPQPGVDSIQLVRRDGTWLIAAITNEVPMQGWTIPEVLREGG